MRFKLRKADASRNDSPLLLVMEIPLPELPNVPIVTCGLTPGEACPNYAAIQC